VFKTYLLSILSLLFLAACFNSQDGLANKIQEAYQKNDYETAFVLMNELAETGKPEYQSILGGMYSEGIGTKVNIAKALEWERKAAEQGYAEAQYAVALILANNGHDRSAANLEEAIEWYRKAAHQNHPEATYNLGNAYLNGRGMPQDDVQAFKWFERSAKLGLGDGQRQLAGLYATGRGVVKSDDQAFYWAKKAAEQNVAMAQNMLGVFYMEGVGVQQNVSEASKWYRKAAELNDKDALVNLGLLYFNVEELRADKAKGLNMISQAASEGSINAIKTLVDIYSSDSDYKSQESVLFWQEKLKNAQ